MSKIAYAQTALSVEDIQKLKEKSGEESVMQGLAKAVDHYLNCKEVDKI